ncbi:hydantoinase B/oxoprolinase family protein [Gayadomonas joobiniege]|uniref:hydantoinase B/oxoprolinase family protein n=1 Tax=Gayadomonas joobiniege TaxID=1234606 RepID=UPI00036B0E8C|nr:hydantoinase B/oxoprolinase family protein [Gayadomonas joobiniege]
MTAWQFWIDRGGTFTDVVAQSPDGQFYTHKLLSDNPKHYANSAVQGIRDVLGLTAEQSLPKHLIKEVKVGTTVATNALLERKGAKTALVLSQGFKDALAIAYQNRDDIFALNIKKPEALYQKQIEVRERTLVDGQIETQLDQAGCLYQLKALKEQGFNALAVVLMHAWKNPKHELMIAELAKQAGFSQVSLSHQASSTIKLIERGDTCVADAYLTPVMQNYVQQISAELGDVPLYFMQSAGSLAKAEHFNGKDAVLSGPAGGIVGVVKTAAAIGFNKLIAFDMGGTSTDVAHYAGQYEQSYQTQVAGVRISTPMMDIHTVAAGGGSICYYQDGRFQVGPESAGSNPGPACYRNGGPLTVTDCNLILGHIEAEAFPAVFGPDANQPLSLSAARDAAEKIRQTLKAQGIDKSLEAIAEGFLAIAVENMANAVRNISTRRGYDLADYVLSGFGGAGGQHVCAIAETLGMKSVLLHPCAGVLSALGIGLAEQGETRQLSIQQALNDKNLGLVTESIAALKTQILAKINPTGEHEYEQQAQLLLKYTGAEVTLNVDFSSVEAMQNEFNQQHQQAFGFSQIGNELFIDSIVVTVQLINTHRYQHKLNQQPSAVKKGRTLAMVARSSLPVGAQQQGPALIVEENTTTFLKAGWSAKVLADYSLLLSRHKQSQPANNQKKSATELTPSDGKADPVTLEIFNNHLMTVATQMGEVLARTAHSVNIRERLDFSCALFDNDGQLLANAPHVPVHLGSMSHSVKHILASQTVIKAGDSFLINSPYAGGTHLPDLTLVSPVFDDAGKRLMFVASRAHHADVGGITPGSMPAHSKHINEEGLLFDGLKVAQQGQLDIELIKQVFAQGQYPARNINQNIADLAAQLAANKKGMQEMLSVFTHRGQQQTFRLMQTLLDNGEAVVRQALAKLNSGHYQLTMDTGATINVSVDISQTGATIDFSGSNAQQANNYNAPIAVTYAAVIYVLRCLAEKNVPLNEGCLRPVKIITEPGSLLEPVYPAAVVAGNVEVSQAIVSALFMALNVQACGQTTMNNLSFGNQVYQYYETLAGGTGAGPGYNGCDAVQNHMTNSRLTDPEVLEQRFPVRLRQFSIRENSGGRGQWSGGNGLFRIIEFTEPMSANLLTNSRVNAPQGLQGAEPGLVGENRLIKSNGKIINLPYAAEFKLEAGDKISIKTPGGGGYGCR